MRNTTYSFERKNIDTEGVCQQSFIKNVCERMIKPAVNTTLEIQSTQRRTGIQLKLNEFQDNNKRSGMKFSGIKDKAVQ